jgi:hypothetical protein
MVTKITPNNKNTAKENDVLFQKLGGTWYAFSTIEGEVVYSALPDGVDPTVTRLELFEVIEDHMKKIGRANARKRRADIAA